MCESSYEAKCRRVISPDISLYRLYRVLSLLLFSGKIKFDHFQHWQAQRRIYDTRRNYSDINSKTNYKMHSHDNKMWNVLEFEYFRKKLRHVDQTDKDHVTGACYLLAPRFSLSSL